MVDGGTTQLEGCLVLQGVPTAVMFVCCGRCHSLGRTDCIHVWVVVGVKVVLFRRLMYVHCIDQIHEAVMSTNC